MQTRASTRQANEIDYSHLNALQARHHREKMRLAEARQQRQNVSGRRALAIDNEIAFREREIAACEREIAGEYRFLGIEPPAANLDELSDDALLSELQG